MEEKGTTAAVLGLDVGKASHWACGVDSSGRVVLSERVANRAADVDAVLARAGSGALVVVDQKRNIGALVASRGRAPPPTRSPTCRDRPRRPCATPRPAWPRPTA